MNKILVIYAGDWGNTKKMADSIAKGASSVGQTDVSVKSAESVTDTDLLTADGFIVGSPVHMGGMDWRIKSFIDKVCGGLWMKDALVGKVAGVFVSGGGYGNAGGGVELTMLSMMANLAELGLLLVPLPKNTPGYHKGGLHWGPYARSMGEKMEQTGVQNESLEAAEHHGAHIARVAALVKGKTIFA